MTVSETDTKVTISLPNGSSAEIYKYGATITSWKAPDQGTQAPVTERLFVSAKAILDGSKPIRGGIPIAFPFFGPPTKEEHKKMSQHGFARSEVWRLDTKPVTDRENVVTVVFRLELNDKIKKVFDHLFALEYHVTLTVHELTTRLLVSNKDNKELTFQTLLHTYFECDSSKVTVTNLTGKTFIDKTKTTILDDGTKKPVEGTEERAEVDVKEYTDRIYQNAGRDFKIKYSESGGGIQLHTKGFADVVVWNPNIEASKAITDLAEDGWKRYICVEPGMASYWTTIEAGENSTWEGQQVLSTLPSTAEAHI